MKIRSLILAGVAAGALLAPVAAPAVQSIPIPASGPAGAEVLHVAGKKDKAQKKQAGEQRKGAKKAKRKGGGKRHAGAGRKGGEAGKTAGGKREARRDVRKADKPGKIRDRAAAARRDGGAERRAVRAWRDERRDDRREARREDRRQDDPRLLYRHGNRDDPRPAARDWRDDDRSKVARRGWDADERRRVAWRDDDHRRAAWRDDDRRRAAWRDDDGRRAAWRDDDRRRGDLYGWRDDDPRGRRGGYWRDDRHDRHGWREASRHDDRHDREFRRDRAFLLFAPDRRVTGWSEPRRVRVNPTPGARWDRRVAAATPLFDWRPAPVTSLFGLGSAAHAYPYGWDYAPRPRGVRVADTYRSGVYRTPYLSPYSGAYQAWRPDAFDVGYGYAGSGSLFGDLAAPLTALALAAFL
ncbi:hypothetical protein [uncultured Albimonas sp.]|uniref:hypothetical protein n=1 Tax=uncultured Albimonas sp. TaxID=1331701 RepID=UPI0030EDCCBF